MNQTPHLAGSMLNSKPLLSCVTCKRYREPAGGVTQMARFICADCIAKRMKRG